MLDAHFVKMEQLSLILWLGLAAWATAAQPPPIILPLTKSGTDRMFDSCDLATIYQDYYKFFGGNDSRAYHAGFWTCLSLYNSADWNADVNTASINYRCAEMQTPSGRSQRCVNDYYGLFNLGDEWGWCEHKVLLKGEKKIETENSK